MTCAACARHVVHALEEVAGEGSASVNVALAEATVAVPNGLALPEAVTAMEAAVEEAGYRAIWRPPETTEPDGDHFEEAAHQWRVRTQAGVVLGVPVMGIEMGAHWGLWPHGGSMVASLFVPVGTAAVMLLAGWPIYTAAWRALPRRQFPMDVLVAIGTLAAYLYSVGAMVLHGLHAETYFESAAVIVVLVALGRWLEHRARHRAGESIRALLNLTPPTANRLGEDGVEREIPLRLIRPGDRLMVRPGETIPIDGRIERGESLVDESMLTGEWMPQRRGPGDIVHAGTRNSEGALLLVAERVGSDTALARITAIVRAAQGSRAPVQDLADRVSNVFVPIVMGLALATFLGWGLVGGNWVAGLITAVAVLVVACPCALGLATPMALVVGTGLAARRGILFRDISAVQAAATVDTAVLDKTGTLTVGQPQVIGWAVADGQEMELVKRAALALERGSEHALGKAIVREVAAQGGSDTPSLEGFRGLPGKGVVGQLDGVQWAAGTSQLGAELGAGFSDQGLMNQINLWEEEGMIVVRLYVQTDSEWLLAGAVALSDEVAPESAETLGLLRRYRIESWMLTGDGEGTARRVAAAVGLDPERVMARVRPEEKADRVRALESRGRRVAMVGDGVNDAPALATATLGVAMGTGTDVARETAGVTLLRRDLRLVPEAILLGRATMSKIRQNLFWAFAYNVVLLPMAMAGLLAPWLAGAAMAFSSLSVVANSLLLRRHRGIIHERRTEG
jgi:Cu+-exporting ATPase